MRETLSAHIPNVQSALLHLSSSLMCNSFQDGIREQGAGLHDLQRSLLTLLLCDGLKICSLKDCAVLHSSEIYFRGSLLLVLI